MWAVSFSKVCLQRVKDRHNQRSSPLPKPQETAPRPRTAPVLKNLFPLRSQQMEVLDGYADVYSICTRPSEGRLMMRACTSQQAIAQLLEGGASDAPSNFKPQVTRTGISKIGPGAGEGLGGANVWDRKGEGWVSVGRAFEGL